MNKGRSDATKSFLTSPDLGFIRFNKNTNGEESNKSKETSAKKTEDEATETPKVAIDTDNAAELGYQVIASNTQYKGLQYQTKFLSPAGKVSFLDEDSEEIEIDFDSLPDLAEADSDISMSEGSDLASYFFSNGVEISSSGEETIEIRTVPDSVLAKLSITDKQWDTAKVQAKSECDGGVTPIWLNTVSSFKINNFQFNEINVDPVFLENKNVSGVATFADLKATYQNQITDAFTPDIRTVQTSFNNIYFLCGGSSPKVWKYTLDELIANNVETSGEYWNISMQRPIDSQYLSQVPISGGKSLANITMGGSSSIFELPRYDHVEKATILPMDQIVQLITNKAPEENPSVPESQDQDQETVVQETPSTELVEQAPDKPIAPTVAPQPKVTPTPSRITRKRTGPLRQKPVIFNTVPEINTPGTTTQNTPNGPQASTTQKTNTATPQPDAPIEEGDLDEYQMIKEQVMQWTQSRPKQSDKIYSGILKRQFADYMIPNHEALDHEIQYMLDPTKIPVPQPAGYRSENSRMWMDKRFLDPNTSATDTQVADTCGNYTHEANFNLRGTIHAPYEYYHQNNAAKGQYYIPSKKLTFKDLIKTEIMIGIEESVKETLADKSGAVVAVASTVMETDAAQITNDIGETVFNGTMFDTPLKVGADGTGQDWEVKFCFNPQMQGGEPPFDAYISTYQTSVTWTGGDWKPTKIKKYEKYFSPKEDRWLKAQHTHVIDYNSQAYKTVENQVSDTSALHKRRDNSPSQMHVFCSDKVKKCFMKHKLSFRRAISAELLSINIAKNGIYKSIIDSMLNQQSKGMIRRNEILVYGALEINGSAEDPSQWRWVSLQTLKKQGILNDLDPEIYNDVEVYLPGDTPDSYVAGTLSSTQGPSNAMASAQ